MLIFQVTAIVPEPNIVSKIASVYGTANLRLGSGYSWLVADTGVTTRDVSDKLGLVPGSPSQAIVVKVEGYFGLAQNNVWEWLKVKSQGT